MRPRFRRKHHAHAAAGARTAQVRTGLPAGHRTNLTAAAIGCRGSPAPLPIQQLDSLGVEKNFKFFARNGTEARRRHIVAKDRSNRNVVLAVGWEDVLHQHPAARAERQSFDVIVLRRVLGRPVDRQRRRCGFANREAADLLRRRNVSFDQGRRNS